MKLKLTISIYVRMKNLMWKLNVKKLKKILCPQKVLKNEKQKCIYVLIR